MRITAHYRGDTTAGSHGFCEVTFHQRYEGERADLLVEAHDGADREELATHRWCPHSRTSFEARMLRIPVVVPTSYREVTFSARLYPHQGWSERRDAPRPALDDWRGVTAIYPVSQPTGTSPVAAFVARAEEPVTSIYQLLARREAATGESGIWEKVFGQILLGLRADLDGLIDREYRTFSDEIGEDGEPLRRLMPWQKWAIKYATGLYYAEGYKTQRAIASGLGYPIGVMCDSLTDTLAWARGVTYPRSMWSITAREHAPDHCVTLRDAALRADPQSTARFEPAPFGVESLRPGSLLTFRGHVCTVFRVRRTPRGVRFQLFDTGGTGAAPRLLPATLEPSWGGVMKEEPWRPTLPNFSSDHPVTGHLFLPSQERADLPIRLYCAPTHPAEGVEGEDRHRLPLVQLTIADRGSERVLWKSQPLRLTVPLIQLVYSVTNLPHSDRFEARWFVDGGHYKNRKDPSSGRLFIEIYNTPEGEARHWRTAYCDASLSRRSQYLGEMPDPWADHPISDPDAYELQLKRLFAQRG